MEALKIVWPHQGVKKGTFCLHFIDLTLTLEFIELITTNCINDSA